MYDTASKATDDYLNALNTHKRALRAEIVKMHLELENKRDEYRELEALISNVPVEVTEQAPEQAPEQEQSYDY